MNMQGGALTAQARPGLTRNLPSRAILTVVLCVDPACRLCVCVCVRVYVYVYQYHMCACVHVCMCLCLCVCVCVCVHRLLPTGGGHSCGLMHPLRTRCRHARADTVRGACLPLAPSRSQSRSHTLFRPTALSTVCIAVYTLCYTNSTRIEIDANFYVLFCNCTVRNGNFNWIG